MDAWRLEDNERLILLDALVTYADACTLPDLTPSCPYYRRETNGPTCNMECRDVVDRYGGRHSDVRDFKVGGLVMTGLALPRSTAGAQPDYDARRLFLAERQLPPRQQSTGALLLGLEAALRRPAFGSPRSPETALALWGELAQRGLDVDSVVRGALLPTLASAIGFHAAWPDFVEEAIADGASAALAPSGVDAAGSGWRSTLLAVEKAMPSAELQRLRPYRGLRKPASDQAEVPPWEMDEEEFPGVDALLRRPTFQLAISNYFLLRVEEWLSRLLDEDMQAFLLSAEAPPSILLALAPAPLSTRDEVGLWVYERLTITSLDEWADSSLMLEWRASQGETFECCPDRLVRERDIDGDVVANSALARMSRRRGRRARPRGLDASDFVKTAVRLLHEGKPAEAAEIFAGIIALRPGDGEALNNYGFCLLPVDPEAALVALQGAALYNRREPAVNLANRALALHLLGRNEESVALADEGAAGTRDEELEAILWSHDCASGRLTLIEDARPTDYCRRLSEHIRCPSEVPRSAN